MDIRIVNTCNNNCLYCLEQKLRRDEKFISSDFLSEKIIKNSDNNITFYGGNPLLHPGLLQIIEMSKKSGKGNIGILSNTFGLNTELLNDLMKQGLNNFGFYFYSFNPEIHNIYSGGSLKLKELCKNIQLLQKSGMYVKAIIHVNAGNINTIAQDIYYLNSKFGIQNFEFVNYLIVDRAIKFEKKLKYNIDMNRENISNLFEQIKRLNLSVKFVRFEEGFFGENTIFFEN